MRLTPLAPVVSRRRLERALLRILEENELCAMATHRRDGRAHVNTTYFCFSDELRLYFLSDPRSLHCRNLRASPSIAMAIFRSDQPWGHPGRGAQLFGAGREVAGGEARIAEELYARRFPAYRDAKAKDPRVGAYRFHCFVPSIVKVLDEVDLGDALFVSARVTRGGRARSSRSNPARVRRPPDH